MEYYKKEDLRKISITQFSNDLKANPTIKYTDSLTDDLDSEFTIDDADVFRQGICQLFAYALNQKFGYKVYVLEAGPAFHVFCKSNDGTEYIDVRGKTKSFEDFVAGSELPKIEADTSVEYVFTDDDFNGEYYDIGLAFAYIIIENDIERYK